MDGSLNVDQVESLMTAPEWPLPDAVRGFAMGADEWFMAHATLATVPVPSHFKPWAAAPATFAAAHAAELYIKAAHVQINKSAWETLDRSHDLQKLLRECKEGDSSFLSEYELREQVCRLPNPGFNLAYWKLLPEDQEHWKKHMDLYQAAKLIVDLKYVHTPLRRGKPRGAMVLHGTSDYWIRFVRAIKSYLISDTDLIREALNEGQLPLEAARYLQQLYT